MSKSILLKIEPSILKYARKYSGFSLEDVSKKTKISIEKIKEYEENISEIPLTQIEKFSNIYKRPLAYFLLLKIPHDVILPKDFRIVYKDEELLFSPEILLAIRRARFVQTSISEIEDVKFEYKFPRISMKDDADKIAEWFRKFIGVDLEKQKKWHDAATALREWRKILEEKNIFVLQQNFFSNDISAFCLVDKDPYIIMLNNAEHENRRIFSLFHEVGHILLHKSGICKPDDLSKNSYEYVKIEKFCNQISASILVPKDDFVADMNVKLLSRKEVEDWDENIVKIVARKFKVSREVILRRFLTFGLISEKDYNEKQNFWVKENSQYKKIKKKDLKIPQYIISLSQNGRGVSSLILENYHNNKIGFSAVTEILNLNAKHVSKLEMNLC
ncbi:MAG: XRE family transcriptional regulator [Patescibacteria group bacterium]